MRGPNQFHNKQMVAKLYIMEAEYTISVTNLTINNAKEHDRRFIGIEMEGWVLDHAVLEKPNTDKNNALNKRKTRKLRIDDK